MTRLINPLCAFLLLCCGLWPLVALAGEPVLGIAAPTVAGSFYCQQEHTNALCSDAFDSATAQGQRDKVKKREVLDAILDGLSLSEIPLRHMHGRGGKEAPTRGFVYQVSLAYQGAIMRVKNHDQALGLSLRRSSDELNDEEVAAYLRVEVRW